LVLVHRLTEFYLALSDGQGFVLSQLSTTSARFMIEKKLAKAAAKEYNLEHGSAKLSDLPLEGISSKLKPLDPYVPGFVVSLVFWGLWVLFSFISILYGLWAGIHTGIMYLTFRPRALRYPGSRPVEKEFSFSEAISIDDVKVVQNAFKTKAKHITLNDVMCAVVSKAVRSYCDEVGDIRDRRYGFAAPPSSSHLTQGRTESPCSFPSPCAHRITRRWGISRRA
jgi:hypothetical protein